MNCLFSHRTQIIACMLLLIGVSYSAWGTDMTFTVSGKTSITPSGTRPAGYSATYTQTYKTDCQMTEGNSATITLSSLGGISISNITLSMKSNKTGGAGKLKYSTDGGSSWTYIVGTSSSGVAFNQSAWYNAWSQAYVNISKDVSLNNVTSLKIMIEATDNSLYCQSYKITYTPSPRTVTFTKADGSTTVLTEASGGAGITPPAMDSPCDGWTFQGWSTSESTSSTSTTVLTTETLTDGKYYPSGDITLYAVYTKTVVGGAADVVWTASAQGWDNAADADSKTISGVTVAWSKGSGSSPKYYTSGTAVRAYGGSTFTVSSSYAISSIVLGFGSDDGSNTISADKGTYSDGTWTGSATTIIFVIDGTTGNRRISTITTSVAGTSTTYYYSYPTCSTCPAVAPEKGSV